MMNLKKYWNIIGILCCIAASVLNVAQAAEVRKPGKNIMKAQNAGPVITEMIIKFKDDSRHIGLIEEVIDGKKDIKSLKLSPYLDNLFKQYRLVGIKRLYENPLSVEEVMKKYPERAKRMPKNATMPNLKPVYIFQFRRSAMNIRIASLQFARDGQIEYAEPNAVAHITPAGQ